jgi:hypothetical protein
MTEPDNLDRNIQALKELQSVAWQQLADPLLTTFERREIRNQIKQSEGELRHYLEMMSERVRFRVRRVDAASDSLATFGFSLEPSRRSGSDATQHRNVRRCEMHPAPSRHSPTGSNPCISVSRWERHDIRHSRIEKRRAPRDYSYQSGRCC